jgi:hypothetical protein
MNRVRMTVITLGACGALGAIAAVPASAKTITLHFFSKQVYSAFTGPTGQPLPGNAQPTVGDRIEFANDEYVGNHKHHAKRPTASVHVDCTVTSSTGATCDGQLALSGGAMLLASNFTISFTSNAPVNAKITAGTNQYRHAHGIVISRSIGNTNNSDDTVKFTP